MVQVSITDAKAHFQALVARAEAGEEIVIARRGRPVARLSALEGRAPILGLDVGVFTVPDDFNEMSPEEIALFEDGELTL
ncbi:MAG: type II toxin-antitoxin system Phd/YefM family antitoxin [Tepidiformaceae bacterium]